MTVLQTAGLSHSEIPGSKVICTSPELVAAYHVLHRLREPRHPPYALSYFLRLVSYHLFLVELIFWYIAHTFSCIEIFFSTVLSVTTCQRSFCRVWNVECGVLNSNSFPQGQQWRITDSNRWPPACKAGALASWANPPFQWRIKNEEWRILNVLYIRCSVSSEK